MDQLKAVIREKILRFHESASRQFPIRKVLLYGSYAKGDAPRRRATSTLPSSWMRPTIRDASRSPRRCSTGQPRSIRR